jgi:hypothetical protein
MGIKEELDRRITLAQSILDSGETLSSVLSQVRLLMTMDEDSTYVALTDLFIHGLNHVPYQKPPFADLEYKKAGAIYLTIFCIEDFSKIDINKLGVVRDGFPKEDNMCILSIHDIESLETPLQPKPGDSHETLRNVFQVILSYRRMKQILNSVRAHVYDKVSLVLIESIKEKDRIDLFGVEYRIVTDRLNCLESPVGNELLAAMDDLESTNPANWNSCALQCRNVILKLAKLLWKIDVPSYTMLDGTTVETSSEKEKNRLSAYIDYYTRTASKENKAVLDEASKLVKKIYGKGSAGKNQVNRSEAQGLLVDTFKFVDLLNKATGLESLCSLP